MRELSGALGLARHQAAITAEVRALAGLHDAIGATAGSLWSKVGTVAKINIPIGKFGQNYPDVALVAKMYPSRVSYMAGHAWMCAGLVVRSVQSPM